MSRMRTRLWMPARCRPVKNWALGNQQDRPSDRRNGFQVYSHFRTNLARCSTSLYIQAKLTHVESLQRIQIPNANFCLCRLTPTSVVHVAGPRDLCPLQ